MRKFTQLNRYLEKISVDPLLGSMDYCVYRGRDSWRKVVDIILLLKVSKVEIYCLFNELTF